MPASERAATAGTEIADVLFFPIPQAPGPGSPGKWLPRGEQGVRAGRVPAWEGFLCSGG